MGNHRFVFIAIDLGTRYIHKFLLKSTKNLHKPITSLIEIYRNSNKLFTHLTCDSAFGTDNVRAVLSLHPTITTTFAPHHEHQFIGVVDAPTGLFKTNYPPLIFMTHAYLKKVLALRGTRYHIQTQHYA